MDGRDVRTAVIAPPAVDVHAHFLPPSYRAALRRAGIERPDGFPFVPEWSVRSALGLMDDVGIDVALQSISSPGLSFVSGGARRSLARTVNEEGAAAVAEPPLRFGLLASLPLPDVDAALAEIAHASEALRADGFVMRNYDGVYLSDERLEPVLAELGRRRAVVLLHPTSPPGADAVALGRPRPLMEFIFETTRTVANLILTGALDRHPSVKLVVPHTGSALPSLADRVRGFAAAPFMPAASRAVDVDAALARLYYDVAGTPFLHTLRGLLGIASADRPLYASDTPFTPPDAVARAARTLVETDLLDADQKAGLFSDNAPQPPPPIRDREAGPMSSDTEAARHHYADAGGAAIHYVRMGNPDGPPVMLVHGFPQTWRCWRRVASLLADRHALVMPDLRGFGDSARPAAGFGASVASEDLIAVLDACGLDQVTLVGHDWGAVVVHLCAARHPERVDRLVFVEAPVLGTDPASWPVFWHMAFFARPDLPEAIIAGNEAAFLRAFMLDLAERPHALGDEDMAVYGRHLADPGGLRSALAWYREGAATDTASLEANPLAELEMPVLALGGVPWGDRPRALMERVPRRTSGAARSTASATGSPRRTPSG